MANGMDFSVGAGDRGAAGGIPARRSVRRVARPTARGRLLSEVFDAFPSGILVVTSAGRVLTWNPALEELLERSTLFEPRATCCSVLGCRTPGTSLEGVCLTQAAVARGERLPEITLELPGSRGLVVSLIATPFHGSRERTVVFQIRPATEAPHLPGPLRRRETGIRIRTLGETVVETPGGELRGDWLDRRPGRLLKYLVTNRRTAVHADAIAEALWPRARADTTSTVRHFIHTLRDKLEPERERYSASAFVIARGGGYQLNPERVVVDADEFEREARAGLAALAAGERDSARQRLEAAVALYRGEFLLDERFEDWAIFERERLRELARMPLRALATITTDPGSATAYLERLVEMEPLDIDVQRELLTAWLLAGRRSRAVRHYRALELRLMRELGERLPFDLGDLLHHAGNGAGGEPPPHLRA
jgi:DNA-binding SARP family transcriptional activator